MSGFCSIGDNQNLLAYGVEMPVGRKVVVGAGWGSGRVVMGWVGMLTGVSGVFGSETPTYAK